MPSSAAVRGSFWDLPLRARSGRRTASCKGPGRSAWWRRSGRSWPCGAGKSRRFISSSSDFDAIFMIAGLLSRGSVASLEEGSWLFAAIPSYVSIRMPHPPARRWLASSRCARGAPGALAPRRSGRSWRYSRFSSHWLRPCSRDIWSGLHPLDIRPRSVCRTPIGERPRGR